MGVELIDILCFSGYLCVFLDFYFGSWIDTFLNFMQFNGIGICYSEYRCSLSSNENIDAELHELLTKPYDGLNAAINNSILLFKLSYYTDIDDNNTISSITHSSGLVTNVS